MAILTASNLGLAYGDVDVFTGFLDGIWEYLDQEAGEVVADR